MQRSAGRWASVWLVEAYAAHGQAEPLGIAAARTASLPRAAAGGDPSVIYLHALFVPQDETLFALFAGESAAAVTELALRAGIRPLRVTEAVLIPGDYGLRRTPGQSAVIPPIADLTPARTIEPSKIEGGGR